jgi:hypothetical protein
MDGYGLSIIGNAQRCGKLIDHHDSLHAIGQAEMSPPIKSSPWLLSWCLRTSRLRAG